MRAAKKLDNILFWRQLSLLVQAGLPLHEAWPSASSALTGRAAQRAKEVAQRLANGELLQDALESAAELGNSPVVRLRKELKSGAPLEDAVRTAANEAHSSAVSRARLNVRLAMPAASVALALLINLMFIVVLLTLFNGARGGMAGTGNPAGGLFHSLLALANTSALPVSVLALGLLLVLAAAAYCGTLVFEWPLVRRSSLPRRRSAVNIMLDLAVLLEDGNQLPAALADVAQQTASPELQARLQRAASRLAQGALGTEPLLDLDLFPPWVVWTMTSQQSPVSLGLYLRELADEMMIEIEEETRRTGNVFATMLWLLAAVLSIGAAGLFYALLHHIFSLTANGLG